MQNDKKIVKKTAVKKVVKKVVKKTVKKTTVKKTVDLMLDISKELKLKTVKKTTVGNIDSDNTLQFTDDNVIVNLKKWVNNDIKGKQISGGFANYLAVKCNTVNGKLFIVKTCDFLKGQYNGKTIQHKINMRIIKKYQDNLQHATSGNNSLYKGADTLTVKIPKGKLLYKIEVKKDIILPSDRIVNMIKNINKGELSILQLNGSIKHLNSLLEVKVVVNN
jgi:hypothetical protein